MSPKARSKQIFLSPPWIDLEVEGRLVEAALNSNYIAPCGPMTDRFERDFAAVSQRKYAVALSSASAALDLLFHTLEISPGDTVFCSDLTFVASIASACHRGAEPVFIDSDTSSWTMDPDLLGEALAEAAKRGKLPKVVVAVDLYGQCCDYRRIENLCAAYEVPLIIDSAEAVGASFEGTPAGSAGFASVFSFNGNKTLTTSGGGILATDNAALAKYIRKLSTQAREPKAWYEHVELGYNYRLSNISAAIGVGQIERLPIILARKQAIFKAYKKALPDWEWMPELEGRGHSRWLSVGLLEPRSRAGKGRLSAKVQRVIDALRNEAIEARPVWKPMHLQPVFHSCRIYGGAVSERLFRDGICLPSGAGLSSAEQRKVIKVVQGVLGGGTR